MNMSTGLDTRQVEDGVEAVPEGAYVGEAWTQEEPYHSLYYTDSWITVVKLLHSRIGLTQAEIARGADVSQATVARWLESEEASPVRAYDRLDDLRYVVLGLLRCGLTPSLIAFWLAAKNIDLGADPLTAIARGGFEKVIRVANAFANGRPPDPV
jgi:transcriptional regulator with XRE-family HTH domain